MLALLDEWKCSIFHFEVLNEECSGWRLGEEVHGKIEYNLDSPSRLFVKF